ncbi:MAG: hypothetical protein WDW36_006313 [Sanguina aurantia]
MSPITKKGGLLGALSKNAPTQEEPTSDAAEEVDASTVPEMLKNAAVGGDLAAAADLPEGEARAALNSTSVLTLADTSLGNLAQVGGIPTENQSSSNAAVEPSSVEDDSPDTQAAKLADENIALSAQLAEMVKQQDLEDAAAAVAAEARTAAAAAAAAGLARLAVAQEANAKVRQQMAAFALRKSPHHTTVTAAVVAQPPPAHTPTTPQPTPTELELSTQREQQLKTKGLAHDKTHQGLVSELAAVQRQLAATQAKVKAGETALRAAETANTVLARERKNVEPPKRTTLQYNADMAALAEKQAESARWGAAMARANILTSGGTAALTCAKILFAEANAEAAAAAAAGAAAAAAVPGNIAACQQQHIAAHADLQAKRKLDSDTIKNNQQQQKLQQRKQRQRQQAQLEAEQKEQQQQTNDFLVSRRSVESAAADDRVRHASEYERAFVAHRESGMGVSEAQRAMAREDPRCGEHVHEPEREERPKNCARAAAREPCGEQGGEAGEGEERGKAEAHGTEATRGQPRATAE